MLESLKAEAAAGERAMVRFGDKAYVGRAIAPPGTGLVLVLLDAPPEVAHTGQRRGVTCPFCRDWITPEL